MKSLIAVLVCVRVLRYIQVRFLTAGMNVYAGRRAILVKQILTAAVSGTDHTAGNHRVTVRLHIERLPQPISGSTLRPCS